MTNQRYKKNILVHLSRVDISNIMIALDFYHAHEGNPLSLMENSDQTYDIIRRAFVMSVRKELMEEYDKRKEKQET